MNFQFKVNILAQNGYFGLAFQNTVSPTCVLLCALNVHSRNPLADCGSTRLGVRTSRGGATIAELVAVSASSTELEG